MPVGYNFLMPFVAPLNRFKQRKPKINRVKNKAARKARRKNR